MDAKVEFRKKSINFIGCGRLGKTIAKLIKMHQCGTITGILNSTYEHSVLASQFIGGGTGYSCMRNLPPADIYFITTRDDLIEVTCNKLIHEANLKKGSIIVHCSGSLSSDVLQPARKLECPVMSIHPVKSFASPEASINHFSGTYCGYEGDEAAFPIINNLFCGIGGILFRIKKEEKTAYHAAGVIANNYLVGLHSTAVECYKLAGVPNDIAYQLASGLMKDALQSLHDSDHQHALTGPLQRGDINVVKNHLSTLESAPHIKEVYQALGKATLPITQHSILLKNDLSVLFDAGK